MVPFALIPAGWIGTMSQNCPPEQCILPAEPGNMVWQGATLCPALKGNGVDDSDY